MKKEPRILFLYTELAGYVVSCMRELSARGAKVFVVRWPVNKEAPFRFDLSGVEVIEREDWRGIEIETARALEPDIVLCSGWVDKGYLSICESFKGSIPTVLLLDNQWEGTLRQKAATILARRMISKRFSKAWVPGEPQRTFALKLGFKSEEVRTGFYVADLPNFERSYHEAFPQKMAHFPKRLLYVGRYLPFKGVQLLWECFADLHVADTEWELWCLGTGDLWEERLIHPAIKHIGFVQPKDMGSYLNDCGVFVLPSTKEPWGVVVQEMAAAGFPLLCSNKVGAASAFLEEGKNGFSFTPGDKASMLNALQRIMKQDEESLISMGQQSHRLASSLSAKTWADTLFELL